MTLKEFIEELQKKNIEISFSGGKLKYSGPEENITSDLIENLKKFKGKLIKHFWPKEFTNFMPINTEGTQKPIFIVHGDNSNYIISDYLGSDQPVYGYFHPGSEGEGISYKSVPEMAKAYLDMLLNVSPEGPYYIMGFSFGGVIAYEMAVQLQKAGNRVPFLVIIDSISPLAKESFGWKGNIFTAIRMNILRPLRRGLKRRIKLWICNYYLFIKKPIPPDRRSYYMWDRYFSMTHRYHPDKFNGDILLFRTKDNISSYKYLGWETLVDSLRLVEVEGAHLELFKGKEKVETLQKEIGDYLKKARI